MGVDFDGGNLAREKSQRRLENSWLLLLPADEGNNRRARFDNVHGSANGRRNGTGLCESDFFLRQEGDLDTKTDSSDKLNRVVAVAVLVSTLVSTWCPQKPKIESTATKR